MKGEQMKTKPLKVRPGRHGTPEEEAQEERDYKAWLKRKEEAEKKKTRGAENAPDALYSVYFAIRKNLKTTDGMPHLVNLYFMSNWHVENHPDAAGVYGYGVIMINKDYYQEHGTDEAVINTMFHEMVHAYCDMKIPEKKIKDTEGGYHLPAFKEACERFGGICDYANAQSGYSNARLSPGIMEKVRKELAKNGSV